MRSKDILKFLTVILLCHYGNGLRAQDAKPITFDDHIAPIFKRHCVQCHGETKQKAGLDLSSYLSTKKGGGGGPVVLSGQSGSSSIFKVITAENPAERMPPENDALPKEQVALIKAWIDSGLRQNAGSAAAPTRILGFTPAAVTNIGGPVPMPSKLSAVEKIKTTRPFPILALASSNRAPLIASASYGAIDFVDPKDRSVIGSVAFPEGEPQILRFSKSGGVLLAAGGRPVQNGVAVLFDVVSGKRLAEIGNESDAIIAADISADEKSIAIGGSSRIVKIFSTKDGTLLHTLVKHTDWVTAIAFSPDGKLLATGDRTGLIHIWDATSGGVVFPLSEHKASVRSLAWRSDSKALASSGDDGLVVWWDVSKGWPSISKPDAHPAQRPAGYYGKIPNGVLDVAFGPKGELVTCGRDQTVKVWATDGQLVKTFSILEEQSKTSTQGIKIFPTRVALSFDGTIVVAGESAGRIHSWPLTPSKK